MFRKQRNIIDKIPIFVDIFQNNMVVITLLFNVTITTSKT